MTSPVEAAGTLAGTVAGVCRYPVKSLGGELLDGCEVTRRGLDGDRLWAVRDPDGKLGSGKSTRRFRKMDGLLQLSAALDGDVPVVTFPDGARCRGDEPGTDHALSRHVGRPVALGREGDVSHFDDSPLHLVTTSSLRAISEARRAEVDPRRFRPNLVLDTGRSPIFVENEWVDRLVAVGATLVLRVRATMPRCVMVNLDQQGLPLDRLVLSAVVDVNDGDLGVMVDVEVPGPVAVGDQVRLLS